MRINSTPGGYDELTRYVGTKYDVSDQLNYMQARYQDRARGKFISEDPTIDVEMGSLVTIQILPSQNLLPTRARGFASAKHRSAFQFAPEICVGIFLISMNEKGPTKSRAQFRKSWRWRELNARATKVCLCFYGV